MGNSDSPDEPMQWEHNAMSPCICVGAGSSARGSRALQMSVRITVHIVAEKLRTDVTVFIGSLLPPKEFSFL